LVALVVSVGAPSKYLSIHARNQLGTPTVAKNFLRGAQIF